MRVGLDSLNQRNRTDQPFTVQEADSFVRYFDRHGSANDRLLSHYLLGRAYHEQGDAPMALHCYHDALDQADTTAMDDKDYAQLSRVYGQMADIFYQQGLYHEQLECESLSVKYAYLGKDTLTALMSYEQTAYTYERIGLTDSAIHVIENVARRYEELGLPTLSAISLGGILRPLIEKRNYLKVKAYMDRYEAFSGRFDSIGNIGQGREIYYNLKGQYFLGVGMYDSAEFYFQKELQTGKDFNNQMAASHCLASLYNEIHRSDSAIKYSLYAYALNDSVHAHKEIQTVKRMESMYNYTRYQNIAEKERRRAILEKDKRRAALLLLILGVIAGTWIICKMYIDRKKREKKYEEDIALLAQTQQEVLMLREHEDEYQELIAEKEHLIELQMASIQRLRKGSVQEHAAIDKCMKDSAIYNLIVRRKKERKLTNEEINQCHALIIEYFPNLSTLLHARQHQLNKTDYNVCILFRMGFKSKEVSNMLGISQARVSQVCPKILKTLFGKEHGGAQELSALIMDIY